MTGNPLIYCQWTWRKLRATVVDDVCSQVLLFTLVSIVVTCISANTHTSLAVSNQLMTVLGIVLGLVVSFRTSTAYERYQEGRQMWTNIIATSKYLANLIWVHVPSQQGGLSKMDILIQKKTMLNLISAYAVSVKHVLRGEAGAYYEDLFPLIAFLPQYDHNEQLPIWCEGNDSREGNDNPNCVSPTQPDGAFRPQSTVSDATTEVEPNDRSTGSGLRAPHIVVEMGTERSTLPSIRPGGNVLRPAENPPPFTMTSLLPVLRPLRGLLPSEKRNTGAEREAGEALQVYSHTAESDVPTEIGMALSSYVEYLMARAYVKDPIAAAMLDCIAQLQRTLSNLERVCNTPIPFAYQVHLRVSVWLYLFALPFQIYQFFGYLTIPATFLTSALLLGFIEIGHEIENPFNYDLNDLDLDAFCLGLHRDLHAMTTFQSPIRAQFIYSENTVQVASSPLSLVWVQGNFSRICRYFFWKETDQNTTIDIEISNVPTVKSVPLSRRRKFRRFYFISTFNDLV